MYKMSYRTDIVIFMRLFHGEGRLFRNFNAGGALIREWALIRSFTAAPSGNVLIQTIPVNFYFWGNL